MLLDESAQGTVEYAVVLVALMGMVAVLALLWRAGERGALTKLATEAASHCFNAFGALDIALF